MEIGIATIALLGYQLAMGIGLAAGAGLRAFLPLLSLALAARMGWLPLAERFQWLASDQALVVLAVAVVLEVLADKIPVLDHLLDGLATLVRPAAGALAAAAPLHVLDPLAAAIVGIVVGGTVAGGVHLGKASARLASTGTTGGLGNPVLSTFEDLGSLLSSLLALLAPLLAAAAVLLLLAWLWRARRRRRARGSSAPAATGP